MKHSKLLGLLVRDVRPKLLLKGHDQLDLVQGVGPEILDELGLRDDLILGDAELLDDDFLHLVCD